MMYRCTFWTPPIIYSLTLSVSIQQQSINDVTQFLIIPQNAWIYFEKFYVVSFLSAAIVLVNLKNFWSTFHSSFFKLVKNISLAIVFLFNFPAEIPNSTSLDNDFYEGVQHVWFRNCFKLSIYFWLFATGALGESTQG